MNIGTLEKTFKIIDLLGENPRGIRLSELSRVLDLPESSIHHILKMLRSGDYVDQDPETRRYILGFKFLSVGSKILSNLDIRGAAYNHLRSLHHKVNETVNLTILRNGQVTFIDKIQKVGGLSLDTYLGFSTDPHSAASGKVLLSGLSCEAIEAIYRNKPLKACGKNTITSLDRLHQELADVRLQGYAIDDEEHYQGVRCVAAPIRSRNKTIAAISITGSIFSMTVERIGQELIGLVKETAARISAEMPR